MASISSCDGAAVGASSDQFSSSASSPMVINNIVDLIPIKLDGTNYLMWRSLFEPILRGQNLMYHVDGSVSSLSCDSPEFHLWYVTNQALLSWINATPSLSALPYTIGTTSAKEAWDKLARRFGKITSAHVLSLRKQLHNIKKGSLSMGDYLQRFKMITY